MNIERYRRFRAQGIPATLAAQYASTPLTPWVHQPHPNELWLRLGSLDAKVEWEPDPEPEEDPRGTFSNNPLTVLYGARKVHDGSRSPLMQYFEPKVTALRHRWALSRMGYSKGMAEQIAQSYVSEDLRAMRGESWLPLVLTTSIYARNGVRLATDRRRGIEIAEYWPNQQQVLDYLATDPYPVIDAAAKAQVLLTALEA